MVGKSKVALLLFPAILLMLAGCGFAPAASPTATRRAAAATQSRPEELSWTSTPVREGTAPPLPTFTPVSSATPEAIIPVQDARCAAFHPNGNWVALGTTDGAIVIWDVSTGRELRRMKEHTGMVASVDFSADGSLLASGSADKTVIVWESATGKVEHRLTDHTGEVTGVAFADYGAWLFTGSLDGRVWMWDASDGSQVAYIQGKSGATGIAYSTTRLLAIAREDGTVLVPDWMTQKDKYFMRAYPDLKQGEFTFQVLNPRLAFSPDGSLLACPALFMQPAQKTGKAYVWDMKNGELVSEIPGNPRAVAFSPDGKRLAVGQTTGVIEMWDAQGKQKALAFQGEGSIWDLAFSPDGKRLVAVGTGQVQVWQTPPE